MEISEFLLYDLDTLKAATNNFCVENKLGEGGFGPVYKVMDSCVKFLCNSCDIPSLQTTRNIKNHLTNQFYSKAPYLLIRSQCSTCLGHATRWAGDCCQEALSIIMSRKGGDEKWGSPVSEAQAQKPRTFAWLLHQAAWDASRVWVPPQQLPRQNPLWYVLHSNNHNTIIIVFLSHHM